MATRLLPYDHPILLTPTEPFNWNNIGTWSSEHTRKSLEECVKVFEGVGLSANQIGIPWRVFSTNIGGVQETHFNPVIVAMSFEMITQEEGCLSFPGLKLPIKRPVAIELAWFNEHGNINQKQFNGIHSRVIQHEMDHLDGVTFVARANIYHRQKIYEPWVKVYRKNISDYS